MASHTSRRPINHLATTESFRFALNIAILATLLVVGVVIVGQMNEIQSLRSRAYEQQMQLQRGSY